MTEQQKKAVEAVIKWVVGKRYSLELGMTGQQKLNASNLRAAFEDGVRSVLNNPSKYGLQPISKWVSVKDRLPMAWEVGNWDGKRTDEVLIRKTGDRYTIGRLYTGVLDGRVFTDWIEGKEEWGIDSGEVTHWQPLPQPPINE